MKGLLVKLLHQLDNYGYSLAQERPLQYHDELEEFTRLSDEKRKIADYVLTHTHLGSVLDIGAGTGEVANKILPKSKDTYTAIEQNPSLCYKLGKLGIDVVQGNFPALRPDAQYDTVLMSHSLPAQPDQYVSFIETAESLTAPEGKVVIVTFSDKPSEYATIMNEIGHYRDTSGDRIDALSKFIESRGTTSSEQLTSYVRSTNIQDVINAIAFVGSTNGNLLKRKSIQGELYNNPHLLDPYRSDSEYTFPMISQAYTLWPNTTTVSTGEATEH